MIKIKNTKILKCNVNCNFHWSKLPKMLKIMLNNRLNLHGADLQGAILIGADLYGADLRGTNLNSANLRSADLRGTNLNGTNLIGAKLNPLNGENIIIKDFMTVTGLGSINRQTILFDTNIGIVIQCGCFYGIEKEFKKKVKETHKDTNYEKEYLEMIKLAKIRFNR